MNKGRGSTINITGLSRLIATGRITQVVTQFPAKRTLDQRLLQGGRQMLNLLGRHRALDKLIKQLLGNLGQRCGPLGYCPILEIRFARHTHSSRSWYASPTKFRAGSF
jgi:hypothetical protein